MRPYGGRLAAAYRRAQLVFLLVGLLVTCQAVPADAGSAISSLKFRPNDVNTRLGFEHFYSLEYDLAIREFEAAEKAHPEDPFTVNHLLSGVLFRELYHIGALDTELYAKNGFLAGKQFPIDAKAKERVEELIRRSLELSEARLKANPNDVDALYARGVARGMRSTYIGLVQKAWFAALRSAVGARRDHERVLELDPKYTDAKMVVGIHNYVLGSINWGIKVAASIVGLSGSKSKGLEYLAAAGEGNGETSVDSKIALSLFLRREQRYAEALKLVGGLAEDYPRNFLFALENANLLNAAGHGPQAILAFRKILTDGHAGVFAESHMEAAYFGLAEALRGQRDFKRAVEAYDQVLQEPKADPDLRQRATLASGEMYDALLQRDEAVRRYEAVIAGGGNVERAELARKHLKQPYRISF